MYTREEKITIIVDELAQVLNLNEINIHKIYEFLESKSKNEEYLLDVLCMALN
ncbi:MAG: hypothetical protein ACRDD2_12225 [Sarcina sp.]